MLKPDSSFRLSKTAKKLIATAKNKEQQSVIKKMMIDAELSAAIMPRLPRRKEESKE